MRTVENQMRLFLLSLIPLLVQSRIKFGHRHSPSSGSSTRPLREEDYRFYFRHFRTDMISNLNSMPSDAPISSPQTPHPSASPTEAPIDVVPPTSSPTAEQSTRSPTLNPTKTPTSAPTKKPSGTPTVLSSEAPSTDPTNGPTYLPTTESPVSVFPTMVPSTLPTAIPTGIPTSHPSFSVLPSILPSLEPTIQCSRERTQSLIEETNDDTYINIDGDAGLSPGDLFVFANSALETTGFPDGVTSGQCTVLENVNIVDNVYCTMNFDFPEGSIVFQGVLSSISVVRGTGCYTELHGIDVPDLGTDGLVHNITRDTGLSTTDCPFQLRNTTWIEISGDQYVDTDRSRSVTPGDLFVFDNNRLSTADDGTIVGTVEGICIVMPRVNEDTFCMVSYESPDFGTLTAMGSFSSMTITGGTGCFVGVSGIVRGLSHPQGFAYSLSLDPHYNGSESNSLPKNCTTGVFETTWNQNGNAVFVDHNGDGLESPGEMYLIEDHSVRTGLQGVAGAAEGHCIILSSELNSTYCRINFSFEEGTLVAIGFFDRMIIVGTSGCFQFAEGGLMKGVSADGFCNYTFELDS